ncbi:MAG: iron hydrogenase small subunit [Selenomonas sp.]|nr:iron hydrogenase small subunit [Selenomonadales bacterium]MDD7763559.1 iron hydrogenase small subunit [Selenomonadales bacterium]MDY5717000.1 iron hydrogenase small subunit [Selenomonas sp.]
MSYDYGYNYKEKEVSITRRQFIGIIGVICAVLWTGLYTLTDVFVDRNKYIKMRTAGLYKDDEKQAARQSHQNKSLQKMYANLNTQPLQPLAEELFHTRYVDRTAL